MKPMDLPEAKARLISALGLRTCQDDGWLYHVPDHANFPICRVGNVEFLEEAIRDVLGIPIGILRSEP